MHPIAQAVRPIDQHAPVAQCRETAAILAHGAQRAVRVRAHRGTGTPPQRRAGIRPAQLREERLRVGIVCGTCGETRIGTRIETHARIGCGDRPYAFLAARQRHRRPPSRSATARAYALQSTTYGQRPERSTVSLKATASTTSAHGTSARAPSRGARRNAERRSNRRRRQAAVRCSAIRRGSARSSTAA